jgi:hypothetical protein
MLTSLLLAETIGLAVAVFMLRRPLTAWISGWLDVSSPRPGAPRIDAEELAGTCRRLEMLKERSKTSAGAAGDAANFDASLLFLQQAADRLREEPESAGQLGEGMVQVCDLLVDLLEHHVSAAETMGAAEEVEAPASSYEKTELIEPESDAGDEAGDELENTGPNAEAQSGESSEPTTEIVSDPPTIAS